MTGWKHVLTSIADIHQFDNFGLQTRVKHVWLTEFGLEICATRQDHTADIGFVIGNEKLDRRFRYFSHIIVTLFHAETRETERRLTTTTVLFGQIHREFVQDISGKVGKVVEMYLDAHLNG